MLIVGALTTSVLVYPQKARKSGRTYFPNRIYVQMQYAQCTMRDSTLIQSTLDQH